MRQAGRYQPEYRKLRERYGILEICRTPELAAQVTLLPVEQLGVDAAILFSDIMVPVAAMGVDVRIEDGRGPVVDSPIREAGDLAGLHVLEPHEDVPFVLDAIREVVGTVDRPLIGFSGAPFTVASYLIEGGASRSFLETKRLMLSEPGFWTELMERLAESLLAYLRAQVEAGAAAVQLFDSWVGALSPQDYVRHVQPHSRRVLEGLSDLGVPRIHFGVGTGELLPAMRAAGADVVGVDWRVPLDVAWSRIGGDTAVQGNLDPASLLAPAEELERAARDVLDRASGRPGHIFNLGHGVLPQTPPDGLKRLVDLVHGRTGR
jgi:uroporphyrinogen decarboxylase